jgi:hypothetical protein
MITRDLQKKVSANIFDEMNLNILLNVLIFIDVKNGRINSGQKEMRANLTKTKYVDGM